MIFFKKEELKLKLKNSYVLLIAMALFQLVIIGSACAIDVSANDTVELSDDGSSVVMDDNPVVDPSTPTTPQKINTTVVSDDEISIDETSNKTIDLTVNDNESKEITGITANNLTVKEGTKTIKFDYNNSKIIIKDTLILGKHNLLVSYLGNGNYTNSSKNIVLTIFGNYTIQAPSSVNVNSTRTVEVPINVTNGIDPKVINKEDFNVTLTYKDGNVTKNISITDFRIVNNTLIFNYELANNITTSTITLVYNANESVKSANVTLNRIYNVKIEEINTKSEYNNGAFTFKLVDCDNNTENLTGLTLSITLGENIRSGFTGTADKNGIVTFKTIQLYEIEYKDGKISAKYLTVGKHLVELSTNNNVKSTIVKTNLTVTTIPTVIKITSASTIYYNTGYTLNFKVTDKSGKSISDVYVLVQIYTGSKYNNYIFQTNKYGNVNIKAPLTVGSHKIVITSADSRYSANSVTKTITVKKASAKISAPKVTAYYNSGKYFTIKLMNTKKSNAPIYAAKLNIRVYVTKYSYYNYNGQTGVDGKIKLALDSLKPGTYKVEVRGADSKDFSVSKVTSQIVVKKAPTKLYPVKLTAKKGKTTYFKVTVKNYKIKKVISGVKV